MQISQSLIIGMVTLWQVMDVTMAEYLLNTFIGTVGAGNSTFYKLTKDGPVRLVLESDGDADLYVSEKTLKPDYSTYDLQSVTCGTDEVEVPVSFQRPVGVAVYGHPSHDQTNFRLRVYVDGVPSQQSSYITPPQSSSSSHHHTHSHKGSLPAGKDEEESILWTIFVGILKIIFDILV